MRYYRSIRSEYGDYINDMTPEEYLRFNYLAGTWFFFMGYLLAYPLFHGRVAAYFWPSPSSYDVVSQSTIFEMILLCEVLPCVVLPCAILAGRLLSSLVDLFEFSETRTGTGPVMCMMGGFILGFVIYFPIQIFLFVGYAGLVD